MNPIDRFKTWEKIMSLEKKLLEAIDRSITEHPLGPKEEAFHQRKMNIALNVSGNKRSKLLSKHLSWASGKGSIRESDSNPVNDCEVFEGIQLTENAFDEEKGILDIVILKPGLNRSGKRFYTDKCLQEAAPKFKGVAMYADHDTKSGQRERPERSVRDLVGEVIETKVNENGWIVGKARVAESWLKDKISNFQKAGILHRIGISHNSLGRFTQQKHEGKVVQFIESITRPISVDYVTEAGAGGCINFMESNSGDQTTDENNSGGFQMDEKEFQSMKESLEALQESQKSTTDKLEGVLSENETLKKENETLKTQIEESSKASFDAHVEAAIKEADLPEKSKERLVSQFKESTDIEAFDEALKDEVDYVNSIKESNTDTKDNKPVRGLGPQSQKKDSTNNGNSVDLSESFKRLPGVSEDLAKNMAVSRRW
jgi:hypothetical protein